MTEEIETRFDKYDTEEYYNIKKEMDSEDGENICLNCDIPEDESCFRYCWAVQSDWGAVE